MLRFVEKEIAKEKFYTAKDIQKFMMLMLVVGNGVTWGNQIKCF